MSIQLTLAQLFSRDIQKTISEIEAYKDEKKLWFAEGQINNTSGNLALHICGNLQHFIGATLGNTDYSRNRDAEFQNKSVSREELIHLLNDTEQVVTETLNNLSDTQLAEDYPSGVAGKKWDVQGLLIHLHSHLNYHLGQINYHRRLVEE